MMFDIKDKIVLITGGAAGIGASVVRTLLEQNIKHVTILDIDDKNGSTIQEELNTKYGSNRVKFIRCDITQENELMNAFKTVKDEQGYIDVVINNAGIASDKDFVKEIDVNLTALVRSTLQAWDLMRIDLGGRGGTIVNVSSITAICSFPMFPIYSATKAAVLKLSTTLGVHNSRTGVRVLAVCFDSTDTQLISKLSSFDQVMEETITALSTELTYQTPQEAARGLIEAYKKGSSSSVWVVSSGKPAMDVTEKYSKTTEMFSDIIDYLRGQT